MAGQPHRGVVMAGSPDPYLPMRGNKGYRVTHYDLTLDYKVGSARLAGRAVISAVAEQALSRFSLDLVALRVGRVTVNGAATRFSQRDGKLHIRPARPVAPGAEFTVDVRYGGAPAPVSSRWGEIGWDYLDDGVIVASQPIGAPSWFPCNDHPSDKAEYRISVTAASAYRVVANGALVSRRTSASTTTWVYELAAPTSTYLISVQIGRYVTVEAATHTAVPLDAAVPARLVTPFEHDFGRQPEMLAAFARLFGPYPFDRYTVVVVDEELDAPVEAQALSVFGSNHVDGARGSEHLVAHELAHQWFGNSLTVAGWRHIWLNEGFASYAEWLWAEASGAEPAQAHARRAMATVSALPKDLRLADPGVLRMFDDRVYLRGALTLHALRRTIGDPAFFALLAEWTSVNRYGTVTTEAFTALAQRHSPRPLDELFSAWLHDTALPPLVP